MSILSRFKWLYKKQNLKKKYKNFNASIKSYSDNTLFSDYVKLHGNTHIINSTVGRYSYLSGSKVGYCDIGAFCSIGPNTQIGGLGTHPTNMISTHPVFYSNKGQCGANFTKECHFEEITRTNVGNDVWIGANVLVLDGVNIGDGVIIAAGAIVTRDIPDYAIVAGVPAEIKKFRFSEEDISLLKKLKWWDWSDEKLASKIKIFRSGCVIDIKND
ncbi:TPA: CatB-related O-acetyltransferase [Photobacterium damselae]